jgi:molecular chaperone GrpE
MTKAKKPSLAELEQQVRDLNEALLRERADAMNVRRRAEEEKISLASFYKSLVISEFLPVIDNFDRALNHVPKELAASDYIKGVQSLAKQFSEAITKLGVERIKTVGEVFDPNLHEAVATEEGDGPSEEITAEMQAGYRLGDQVLRPAMVKVRS